MTACACECLLWVERAKHYGASLNFRKGVKRDMNIFNKFNKPRVPSKQEMEQLANVFAKRCTSSVGAQDLQDARLMVAHAYIAIFDRYVSLDTRKTGKVMLVLWDAGLDWYELYSWQTDGNLIRKQQFNSDWI
jgi:hypothetical protein